MIEIYFYDIGVWKWDGSYTSRASADKAAAYYLRNGMKVRVKYLV